MLANHIFLFILWVVYGSLHSVLASNRVKDFFANKMGTRFQHYRLGYNVFALVALVAIAWFGLSLQTVSLFAPLLWTEILGSIIALSGLLLMLACIAKYFTGLSGLFPSKPSPGKTQLIISGLHRYVRHPLYLGTFIFLWGLVIVFPLLSVLVSVVAITAYTVVALPLEEKKLVNEFGEQYKAYQKTVPRIIPRM